MSQYKAIYKILKKATLFVCRNTSQLLDKSFLGSRCIPRIAGLAEGTWKPCITILCSSLSIRRIFETLNVEWAKLNLSLSCYWSEKNENIKYFISPTGNRTHNTLHYACDIVPSRLNVKPLSPQFLGSIST